MKPVFVNINKVTALRRLLLKRHWVRFEKANTVVADQVAVEFIQVKFRTIEYIVEISAVGSPACELGGSIGRQPEEYLGVLVHVRKDPLAKCLPVFDEQAIGTGLPSNDNSRGFDSERFGEDVLSKLRCGDHHSVCPA